MELLRTKEEEVKACQLEYETAMGKKQVCSNFLFIYGSNRDSLILPSPHPLASGPANLVRFFSSPPTLCFSYLHSTTPSLLLNVTRVH